MQLTFQKVKEFEKLSSSWQKLITVLLSSMEDLFKAQVL